MRALILAALLLCLGGWGPSCAPSTGQPPPVPTDTPPPPPVDISACPSECAAAETFCPHPVITEAECESRCADALRYTKNSARCTARVSVCNAKGFCP